MSLLLALAGGGTTSSFSASIAEGADTLASSVSVTISLSSAVTDGADVLSASVSPVIGLSGAVTDGADVLAASISLAAGTLSFSADLSEGADVLDASVSVVSNGGADYGKTKKRYVVRVDDKLLSFTNKQAAINYLDSVNTKTQKQEEVPPQAQEIAQEAIHSEVLPEITIDIEAIKAMAQQREALSQLQNQLRRMQYEAILKAYEQWLDEEEIELLLMA